MRFACATTFLLLACTPEGSTGDPEDMGPPPVPARAVCGNGIPEMDEACDDGNFDQTDGCTNACELAVCGDGILRTDVAEGEDAWEQCDDGNAIQDDGCRDDCRAPVCGDGVRDEGERCDDGNDDDTDDCNSECRHARCGDELVNGEEECDDSNGVDTDACTNDCSDAVCGDGIVWEGTEECDGSEECRDDCTLPRCGDGRLDLGLGEVCDDGNESDEDGCLAGCVWASCGDGFVQAGVEECDGSVECRMDCTERRCGDGILDRGEDCDDGNDADDDACTNACEDAVCGDGVRRTDVAFGEPGWEGCDAPDEPLTCDEDCVPLRCGDGVQDPEEACDDGDGADGNDCTNACTVAVCGDGVLREGLDPGDEGYEACDDGNEDDDDDCVAGCVVAFCGDGFLNAGDEQCDDGNNRAGDGCDEACGSEAPEPGRELPLDGAWASVFSNFHPNSACFDEASGNVALMIQSRREIVLVDPATGMREGQVPLGNYSHSVGVACDGDDFYFTDYTANANGPDLFRIGRPGGAAVQISQATAAYGGYPLTVHEGTMWRTNDSRRYDWTELTTLRVSAAADPDNVAASFNVAIPGGIGDLCHDGSNLWVLGNVRQEMPLPGASLYRVDPATGEVLDAYPNIAQCQNGRPAGFACDGRAAVGWLFCFNEVRNAPGGLVEVRLPAPAGCEDCECGNGREDPGEDCDDGNDDDTDDCLSDCTLPGCGDGIVWVDNEGCDDGNDVNEDACRNDCTLPFCGDGIVDEGEACDDGNESNGDACVDECVVAQCGDGHRQLGAEQCDDGNNDAEDGCSPECRVEGREGEPALVRELELAAAWAGPAGNFHPQGATYDAETGNVVLALQSRRRLDFVDPETGLLDGGVALPNYNHLTSVGRWGDRFVFSDYSGNRAGPDLLTVPRGGGEVVVASQEVDAHGGYPLTVAADTIWRGIATPGYDWTPQRTLRIADMNAPDVIQGQFQTPAPVGDLCFDGISLWILGYVHEAGGDANPDADLWRLDPVTGEVELELLDHYRCRSGRPAGLACDPEGGRGWIFCYSEARGAGTLAEFEMGGCPPEGCPQPARCGDGELDAGEACDDGNNEPGDGCDAECVVEDPPPPEGDGPRLEFAVDLAAEWAGVHDGFHPQGICYDAATRTVAFGLQSRRRIDRVDPATGELAGGVAIDAYANVTGVACGAGAFHFSDFTGNAGGPDILRADGDNQVVRVGERNDAFAGFPLAIDGATLWRGNDSDAYDWTNVRSILIAPVADPDNVQDIVETNIFEGIGDLCHDGDNLWALGYVHEDDPEPRVEADVYQLDPASGQGRAAWPGLYSCPRGRPAGIACDGPRAKLWLFCFDEANGDGVLAQFDLSGEPPPDPVCGNGEVEGDEGCDDGNLDPGDGCDAECQAEGPPPVGDGVPEFVRAFDLDAAWSGVSTNFHPQAICYDAASENVVFAIQSRQRLDYVDPATGAHAGSVALGGGFNHVASVACGADRLYFTNYSGNAGGPDLFSVQPGDDPVQVADEVLAFGGYPLTIFDGDMWRTNVSADYTWSDLMTIRRSTAADPNDVVDSFQVPVGEGVGDLCHDGEALWALGYSHAPDGPSAATLYELDPATGAPRAIHRNLYDCPRGRPAGWACDAATDRAWLFCFAEGQQGVLAEFRLDVQPRCGDGRVDDGEGCDDGNNDDGDGCSAACAVEVDGLALVREVPLAAEWASVRAGFHPQGACWDETTGRVALVIQSRARIDLVDPANGNNDQSFALAVNNVVGIGCDGLFGFFISDYTGNAAGPDLHYLLRDPPFLGVAADESAAFGGYPLAVDGPTVFRTEPSAAYDWRPLSTVRTAQSFEPDVITAQFDVDVPEGIGDMCHDGQNLWILANVHEAMPRAEATVYIVDDETGEQLAVHRDFHACATGRPAGLACDGANGRAWVFCFNEDAAEPGSLAEFTIE